jgi:hypothetical protein
MPSLENLKKQAKLVLRWHRERYFPVAAQIRTILPRYSHLTDAEVLAASFKLADAQELVARQEGFKSWQALKTGLAAMSHPAPHTLSKAKLIAAEPQLFVSDIKAASDFFTQKLVPANPPSLPDPSRRESIGFRYPSAGSPASLKPVQVQVQGTARPSWRRERAQQARRRRALQVKFRNRHQLEGDR